MTEGLAHPRNAVVLAQIKAAIRVGVRPSVFRHEWPRSDQVAVLALMAHEDAERARVHEPCGQPIDLAFNPASAGWWDAHGIQCQACAAIAEWEKAHKDDDGPAWVSYVVSTLPPGESLPPHTWPHAEVGGSPA